MCSSLLFYGVYMLQFNCPACDKKYETDDGYAGGQLICDRCGTHFFIPEIDDIDEVIYEYSTESNSEKKKKLKSFLQNFKQRFSPHFWFVFVVSCVGIFCIFGYFYLRAERIRVQEARKNTILEDEFENDSQSLDELKAIQQELKQSIYELKKTIPPKNMFFIKHFNAATADYVKGSAALKNNKKSECEDYFSQAQQSVTWMQDNLRNYNELYEKSKKIADLKKMLSYADKDFSVRKEYQDIDKFEKVYLDEEDDNFLRRLYCADDCIELCSDLLKNICSKQMNEICSDARKAAEEKNWKILFAKCSLILFVNPDNNEFSELRRIAEHNSKLQCIAEEMKIYRNFPQKIFELLENFFAVCKMSDLTDKGYAQAVLIDVYRYILQSKNSIENCKKFILQKDLWQNVNREESISQFALCEFVLDDIKMIPLNIKLVSVTAGKNEDSFIKLMILPQNIRKHKRKKHLKILKKNELIRLECGTFRFYDLIFNSEKNDYDVVFLDNKNRKIIFNREQSPVSHEPVAVLHNIITGANLVLRKNASFDNINGCVGKIKFTVTEINAEQKYVIVRNNNTSETFRITQNAM